MLPIVLGLFRYLIGENLTRPSLFLPVVFFVAIGVLLFVMTLAKGCWTYRTHCFKALDPYTFAKNQIGKDLSDIVEITLATLGDMTDYNWRVNEQKAASYESALRFLTCGSVAFGGGFILLMIALVWPALRFTTCG